jgi:hypothetical protein
MKWNYSRIASAGCQEGGKQKMTGLPHLDLPLNVFSDYKLPMQVEY